MIHTVEILTDDEAAEFRSRVERLSFVDGVATARGGAKAVKQNQQSAADDPTAAALVAELSARVAEHPTVERLALPRKVVGARCNRYGVGDRYGLHVDRAVMGDRRTDLSFTLFLSDPADYDGGELHLAAGAMSPRLKPPAGHLALYPTSLLHQVTEVTRGIRWGFVGWIESWVPDPELRDAIAKVRSLQATLGDHPASAIASLQLAEIAQTLTRIGAR
ncbi:MAG: Fe2+-dependent dioxygenase [Ilumatobacteraceae bacterium]